MSNSRSARAGRVRTPRRDVHYEGLVLCQRKHDAEVLARNCRHDRTVRVTEPDLCVAARPATAHGKNLGLSRGRICVRPGVQDG
jgi:hypothetical protein